MEEKENYFSCDYCHRVGTGITIVNGFKMCPMCLAEYQHKSGENNELREELGKKAREVEQLKKENEELKSAQNKIAIEKLETVRGLAFEHQHNPKFGYTDLECGINKLLAELKGEKDE